MNHVYRLKRSGASQQLQAVPETARSAGKGQSRGLRALAVVVSASLANGLLGGVATLVHAQQAPPAPLQLPQGGVVTRGSASIQSSTGADHALMTVNQASQRAVIDWASFNVGSQARVQFNQPSSSAVVLNQILGHNASQIYGQISANGQVFLSNPIGIYFSPTAQVNVGGLVATTGRANADEFMAGKSVFHREGSTGSVVNEGHLQGALGGYMALLAPEVRNQGVVVAQAGTVALASGEAITLHFNNAGTGLVGLTTTPQAIAALVDNRSAVRAEGGQIILSAHALATLQGSVVKNSGQLSATSLVNQGGKVVLMADTIELAGTSQIEANGPTGGGTVLVGGDWQGQGDTRQAIRVTMAPGARIEANATQQGDGGKVVLWSDVTRADSVTRVEGRIEATGAGAGQGGQVETSGHHLQVDDLLVNTQGPGGAGQWLLDPSDISISTGTTANITNASNTWTPNSGAATSVINATTLQGNLTSNNITITTTNSGSAGSGTGNISIDTNLLWSSPNTLTLVASGGISGTGSITMNGATGTGVVFNQAGNSTYSGAIAGTNATFTLTGGGTLNLTGSNTYGGSTTISAGTLQIGGTGRLGSGTYSAAISNNGTLQYSSSSAQSLSGVISGTGALIKDTSTTSMLTLGGANTYTGSTSVLAGTLRVGAGSTGGSLATSGVSVASGANFQINRSDTVTVAYPISGAGSFSQAGTSASVTILTGDNSYTGGTNILAGVLELGSANAIGPSGPIAFSTTSTQLATLRYPSSSAVNATDYSSRIDSTTTGQFYRINTNGQNIAFATGFGSTSSALLKLGNGTLTLSGANTYTGGTTISAGNLEIRDGGSMGSGAVTNDSTLTFNRSTALTVGSSISGSGALVQAGSGTTILTGSNTYSGTTTISAGTLQIGNGGSTGAPGASSSVISITNGTLSFNRTGSSSFGNSISGTGGVSQFGTGTISLTGTLSYTGPTRVLAGTLSLGGAGIANSAPNSAVTVDTGATLLYIGTTTIGSLSGSGTVLAHSSPGGHTLNVGADNSSTTFSGTISAGTSGGPNLVKQGTGTFVFTGTTTGLIYGMTLGTNVGPLQIGDTGVTGVVNVGKIDIGAGSTVVVKHGGTVNFGGLIGAGTLNQTGAGTTAIGTWSSIFTGNILLNSGVLSLNSGSAGTSTLSLTSAFSINFGGGTLQFSANDQKDYSPKFSSAANQAYRIDTNGQSITFATPLTSPGGTLTKLGAGTLILTGTPGAGTSIYSGQTTISAGVLQIGNGATAGTAGTGAFVNNATLTINQNSAVSLPGALSGAGALNKLGTGTATLSGDNTGFTGSVTLTAGTLSMNSASGLGSPSGISFAGGTLEYAASGVPDYSSLFSSVSGQGYRLSATTGVNATLGSAFGGGAANGFILVKSGAGTITLGGANTYTGLTTVSSGTLAVTHAQGLGTTDAGVTLNGGALDLQNVAVLGEAITVNNVAGNSIMASTGSSSLNGSITRANGAGLTFDVSGTQLLLSGAIAGVSSTAQITKSGAGKLILTSGSNTINGALTIAAGTLNVGNGGSTGNVGTPASLTVNGVLEVDRSDGFSLGSLMNVQGTTVGTGNVRIASGGALTVDKPVQLTGAASTIDFSSSGSMSLSAMTFSTSGATGQINISSNAGVTFTGTTVNASSGTAGATASIKILAGANQLAGVATGGDISFGTGTTSFQTAAGGTVTLFQGNANTPTLDGKITGASGTKKYKTYNANSASLSAAVTGTRNFFYRAAGSGSVTVSNVVATKTYDGTTNAVGFITGGTITGLTGEDALTGALPSFTTATFNSPDAGPGKTLTLGGVSVSNSSWSITGLSITLGGGSSGTINKANATVTANSGTLTYNGSLQSVSGFTATGLVNGETEAVLTGVSAGGSGTNFGTYATTASGTASNYNLSFVNGTLSIGKANLTRVTATKVYDGLLTVSAGDMQVIEGLNGETFTATAGTATISDKNVTASSNALTSLAGLTLSGLGGALPSNYNLAGTLPAAGVSNAVTITPRALGITGIVANNKPYDGTTSATLSTAGVVRTGLISGDVVTVLATGTFDTPSVGTGKTVTLASLYGGADRGNYTITGQSTTTANIEPKPLALSIPGATRAYDGTTLISPTGPIGLSGVIGSEDVALSSGNVTGFVDKNVGTNKPVVYTGFTLTGSAAGNYSLPTNPASTANITPLNLQLTGVAAANKVYDASTSATLTGTPLISSLSGDAVTVNASAASASFADKNVGTGKAVTVTGYSLTGTGAGNYNLLQPTGLAANITALNLPVTGLVGVNKVYDATTTASLSGTASVTPLSGDSISLVGTGVANFDDKNVGTNKALAVTGYSLSGGDAGNYNLVQPTGLTANITRANLAITGLVAVNREYDATLTAPLTGTPAVAPLTGDVVLVTGTGAGAFADKNVGTGKAVTVSGFTLGGTDGGNYNPVQPTGLTADISRAALSITGLTVSNRPYDGTTGATVNTAGAIKTGLRGTDVVTVSATGSFADPNAGPNKTVTLSSSYGGADAGNYTITAQTTVLATIDPKPLGLDIPWATRQYNGLSTITTTGTVTLSGVVSGDDVSLSTGSGNPITGFVDKNVGTGKRVLYQNLSLTGTSASNYTLPTAAASTADITPAPLSVSGIAGVNKVYDGTATASANVSAVQFSGLFNTDTVVVSATGTFRNAGNTADDKNVGTGKTVALSSSYSGADAGNYTITSQATTTADITRANLQVTGISASNKVYDASTAATLSGTAAVTALGSDVVSLAGTGTGAFADKNVGTGKAVTVTGYSLTGTDAGNYTVLQPSGLSADITRADLQVTGISASNKVYDATTAATLSGTAAVTALGSDVVSVTGTGTGAFANKNVGTAKAVTVTGYSLTGADAGNYTVLQPSGLSADITRADLQVTGLVGVNKVYDATTTASLGGTAAVTALGSDVVSVAGSGTGAFANKNVGTNKAVTVTGYSLTGTDAGNYTVLQPTGLTADITRANLQVTGLVGVNKVYDATTTASLGGTAAVTALGSDVVSLAGTGTGAFADKNVGTAKAVTVTGYSLTGMDAGNYTVLQPTGVVANITPLGLQVTGVSAANKVYNANTVADLTGVATVTGLGTDVVAVTGLGSASFADKNVGTNKPVTVTGYSLTGTDAGNYAVLQPTGLAANITRADLQITGVGAASKVYDASTTAVLTGTATVAPMGSDVVNVAGVATGAFANKNVGTDKAVTVTGYSLTGADAGNYTVLQPTGLSANITRATVQVSGVSAVDKVYDATTHASLSGSATVTALGSDVLSVQSGSLSASFADKNVGSAKAVTVSGYALAGADAGNYTLVQPSGLTATISPASLTISGITAAGKTYDGLVDAQVSTAGVVKTGLLGSDVVTVSATGVFADKNAGNGKTVNLSSSYGGADFGNYTISSQASTTANIAPAALTVRAQNASKLIGQADPTFTALYSGFVNGETESVLTGAGVTRTGTDTAANTYTGVLVPVGSSSNYTITAIPGNFTIVPAETLLVTLGNASKAYGAGVPSLTVSSAQYLTGGNVLRNVTVTAGANGSYTYTDGLGTTGSFTLSTTASSTSGVGNYAITLGNFLKSGSNFTAQATQEGNLLVNPLAVALGSVIPTKTYDGNTAVQTTVSVANRVGADDVSVVAAGNFTDHKNVGSTHTYSLSAQLSGAAAGNYYLSSGTLTGNNGVITPAALTISGITAASKTYDGSAVASLNMAGLVRAGLIGSDDVSVSASGRFRNAGNTADDKNVGHSKLVSLSSTYGGADVGNYTITGQDSTTASITPATLTLSGITVANKVYDGTTAATVSLAGLNWAGLVAGDVVNVTTTGVFADKNVGNSKLVSLSSSYSGADVGNYTIVGQATALAHISPASLTISGITAANKTYDGLVDAQVSTAGVVKTGLLGSDVVTVSATGVFADKNAGNGKTVNLSSSYGGADFGNYTISSQASTTANIAPAALTVRAQNASKLIGQADPTFTALYSGFVNGETESVLTGAGVVRTGTDTAANTYTGVLVPVGSSSNYTITAIPGNFTIVPAETLLVTLGNASKAYGASVPSLTVSSAQYLTGGNVLRNVTVTAGANGSYTYTDGLGTTGSFTLSTAASSTSVVGNYAITLGNFLKSGSNFTAQATQEGNLVVNQLAVTLGSVIPTKTYDGNTAVQTTVAVANRVGADDVSVLAAGNFTDHKNVGSTHTYSLSAQLSGAAAGNYYLSSGTLTGSNGVINPAALTISGITAASKTYDGSAVASLNMAGLVRAGLIGSDDVSVSASGVFANANVANGKTVTLSSSYGGIDQGNYLITGQVSTTAGITPKALTMSGSSVASKVYDGNTSAVVSPGTLVGLVGAQTLAVTGTALFASKNVGTQSLAATYTLADAGSGATAGLASNYTLAGETLAARITPRALTISGITASNKVYDGTATATVSTAGVTPAVLQAGGLLAGDSLTVSATGSFRNAANTANDPTAGPAKTVALASTYSGTDVGNYVITGQASATASITPAPLVVTANDMRKTQDGQAFAGGNGVSFTGLVNNESAAVLSGTLAYGGTAQGAVNEGSYLISPSGLSSSNYNLSFVDATLTIVPAPVASSGSRDAGTVAALAVQAEVRLAQGPLQARAEEASARSEATAGSAARVEGRAMGEAAGNAAALRRSGSYDWPALQAIKLPEKSGDGLLPVTILGASGGMPANAALAYEQNGDLISLRTAAPPLNRPSSDRVTFTSRLTEFMVEGPNGQLVEFSGGLVNRRLVVVAPTVEARQLAQASMNLVLAGAIMALGRNTPIMMASLDGVVLDLR